jgi:hypothetical protein
MGQMRRRDGTHEQKAQLQQVVAACERKETESEKAAPERKGRRREPAAEAPLASGSSFATRSEPAQPPPRN